MSDMNFPTLSLLTPEEIWNEASKLWDDSNSPLSLENAVKIHRIPVALKLIVSSKKEQLRKSAWMYIARCVGIIMSQSPVSDEDMAKYLSFKDN